METLYPDVIGSGGAPKRIMKPKRRADGQLADDSDMPGTGIINLQSDNASSQHGQDTPSNPGSVANTPHLRPTGPTLTSLPPKPTAPPQPTALTPPDDNISQGRKRGQGDLESSVSMSNASSRAEMDGASSSSPEKRLRPTLGDEMVTTFRSAPNLNSSELPPVSPPPLDACSGSQITPPPPPTTTTTSSNSATAAAAETPSAKQPPPATSSGKVVGDLVDLLTTRNVRQWREEAVDLFFKDFSSEELDLQVKVSQDIFSNDHTAMVFCKMPVRVREHWVRVLRESHRPRL